MNCNKIKDFLYLYIYNELPKELTEYIKSHLDVCNECNKYYKDLKYEINKNKNLEELSAYIDNELTDNETIQVKKNIINNKKYRENFEKINSLKRLLKNTFSRKEYLLKEDYTKLIFRQLDLMEEVYGKNPFPKVAGIFVVIFIGLFIITLAILGI